MLCRGTTDAEDMPQPNPLYLTEPMRQCAKEGLKVSFAAARGKCLQLTFWYWCQRKPRLQVSDVALKKQLER